MEWYYLIVKGVIILLLSCFVLSGCSLTQQTEKKKEPTMSKQQIFENDQACQKRKNEVLSYLAQEDYRVEENTGNTKESELIEVFYSPKGNQCMFFYVSKLSFFKNSQFYSIEGLDHSDEGALTEVTIDKLGLTVNEPDKYPGFSNGREYIYSVLYELKGE